MAFFLQELRKLILRVSCEQVADHLAIQMNIATLGLFLRHHAVGLWPSFRRHCWHQPGRGRPALEVLSEW